MRRFAARLCVSFVQGSMTGFVRNIHEPRLFLKPMTPERWQQVKAILAEAIECDDGLRRAAFVESSCAADPRLKQEVEALLAFAHKPDDQR